MTGLVHCGDVRTSNTAKHRQIRIRLAEVPVVFRLVIPAENVEMILEEIFLMNVHVLMLIHQLMMVQLLYFLMHLDQVYI